MYSARKKHGAPRISKKKEGKEREQYNEVLKTFTTLRVRLETFRQELDLDPEFSVEDMKDRYLRLREEYAKALHIRPNDLLNTNRLANSIQDRLNERLGDRTEVEQE